jgi:hypothetical protein
MRVNNYIQQFEDETRGTKILNNKLIIVKFFSTLIIFLFLSLFLITMNNKYNINKETDNNKLNTYLQSIHNIKINTPSSKPSYIPSIYSKETNEDVDDIMETKYKMTKYPTYHVKKDESTTIQPTQYILNSFFSMITSEITTESPTPVSNH